MVVKMSKQVVRKLVVIVLAVCMMLCMSACGKEEHETSKVRVGFITLHDDQSTYDKNFIDAAKEVCEKLGIQYKIETGVPEGQECYDAAMNMVDDGYNIIFADSFGHESFLLQAAQECPDVQFCHATGTMAHTAGLDNFHNAFASIYEGRYLAGIAAGMKLNEMIESGKITAKQAVMGYVGAYTYAEVISGYTAFYLGAKSVCPSVTMKVTFTGSWYDMQKELDAAQDLIDKGCVLISQHADSLGAPSTCETAGVPNVSYNGSTIDAAPNTYLVSSKINWAPYFEYMIQCVEKGEPIATDWVGTLATESVVLADLNESVAAKGTAEAIAAAKAAISAGEFHVFSADSFTVKGKTLNSYLADVDTDAAYTPDTEAISDGYFHESEYRSAPYFDLQIDGIELLDKAF